MSEWDDLSDSDRSDLMYGAAEWHETARQALQGLEVDIDGPSDPTSQWVDLWISALSFVNPGPKINPETWRLLRDDVHAAVSKARTSSNWERHAGLRLDFERYFEKLETAYAQAGAQGELSDLRVNLRIAQFLAKYNGETVARVDTLVSAMRDDLTAISLEQDKVRQLLEEARASAKAAAEASKEASTSAEAARVASGQAGTNALALEFETFADGHGRDAARYRKWTIGVLAGAIAVALVFVLGLDRVALQPLNLPGSQGAADESLRWQAVVYRLAIIAGMAGLGAYLGRQAAQHRRLYDWGRTVQAQANSFEAFAEQIVDPDTRKQVQLMFSGRVLGSPPEPTAEKTASRDALQIIADAALKSRPSP